LNAEQGKNFAEKIPVPKIGAQDSGVMRVEKDLIKAWRKGKFFIADCGFEPQRR
jgi:hypothetical protein